MDTVLGAVLQADYWRGLNFL